MEYNFREIEQKWQKYWSENKTYKVKTDTSKPKYYVLDMFPYPSGAGLHVGHPLGYIASDIYTRFKRMQGFNVLHPMGYDAFGLPAEQYAIQTGQHPAITTDKNIKRYREQLDKIGFSYDWSREFRTCDPDYYKWTQWAFLKMFKSWYNFKKDKAEPIETLIAEFETNGNKNVNHDLSGELINAEFSAADWKKMTEKEKNAILSNHRLAYLGTAVVNWCPALGTVLANDEVSNGVSVRGGHPVFQKPMQQWFLRVSAYAERLNQGLNLIDWSESLKEIQRNWIGKSEGAMIKFPIKGHDLFMEIFTTRPDTIFGVTYMTFAPEHEYVKIITTPGQKEVVNKYIDEAKTRTERERMADVKNISGVFTGAYAINPFTNEEVQIWIGDYVLAGYGTGAVMAVPAHDTRDWAFAKHFGLPMKEVIGGGNIAEAAFDSKDATVINSGFITGMHVKDAIKAIIKKAEETGIGYGKVNYRMRDAIFSRQRYWGEPFPIYYKDDIPHPFSETELPLNLPEVDKYLPTEDGQPPLGRAKDWKTKEGYPIELSTMPGFAGSSAYYLRYMDPKNDKELVSKEANNYWQDVDLYIGGTEHATGHLIYSRFWNKVLFDLGFVCKEEPFKKLINQGMIQGKSAIAYKIFASLFYSGAPTNDYNLIDSKNIPPIYISKDIKERLEKGDEDTKDKVFFEINKIEKKLHSEFPNKLGKINFDEKLFLPVNLLVDFVDNEKVDCDAVLEKDLRFKDSIFIKNDENEFLCDREVEKMSKSKFNVVNPDDIVEKYGADTLRLYEMFLGPLEMSKPWDTNGIDGVHRFLRKLWRLFFDKDGNLNISNEEPAKAEYKVIHKTIKKVGEDIGNFSFNTSVSAFMICVNELSELKCNKRKVLNDLVLILAPFAPHIAEELWQILGNAESITYAAFPECNESYLVENSFEYPVSFNGKLRFKLELSLSLNAKEVEEAVVSNPQSEKYLEGKAPKKVIVVPGKIVNVVI